MAEWYARYPDEQGDYVVVFKSKTREEAKAVEKVCCAVMDRIVKSPTDVSSVVHGRWVKDKYLPTHCSVCGELPLLSRYGEYEVLSNYCPNCGARMDGKEPDNGKA